jgi:O-antigen/teichoic acid export membrane protein
VTAKSSDAASAVAGTAALGVLQGTGRALALVFVAAATRVVAPEQFGQYAIVAGLVTLGGFVADFGSTTVITRAVSREPHSSESLLANTIVASVGVGLLAYVAVVLYIVVGPYPQSLVTLVAIGALAIPADAAFTSVCGALDGHGLISRRAIASFVRVALMAGAGAIAIVVSGSIRPAIVLIALGPVGGLLVALWLARRHGVWSLRIRPNLRRSAELFRLAAPFALLGGIGALVARLDLLILSAIRPPASVARYDIALRAAESAAALAAVVGGPALFILSRRLGRADIEGARSAYREAVRFSYSAGIPIAVALAALARPLTNVVLGPEYHDVAPLIVLLAPWLVLSVLGAAQGAVVLAHGKLARALLLSLPVLGVALTLDVLLIPVLGPAGAAMASVGAELASCVVFDRLNHRTLGIHTPKPDVTLVLACMVAGILMYAATRIGPSWLGLLALPILPALLWLTGVVSAPDVRSLRRLIAQGNRV